MNRLRLRQLTIVTVAATLLTVAVPAASEAEAWVHPKSHRQDEPHLLKISSHLLRGRDLARKGWTEDAIRRRLPALRLDQGRAEIEVRLSELTPRVSDRLEAIGMRVTSASERWARVTGSADLESLDEIAALPEVRVVHPRFGAITRTGSVPGQGDISINADDARAAWGLSGDGVRVGILSDSFAFTPAVLGGGGVTGSGCDTLLTGSNPQNSLDLPPQVRLLDNCDFDDGCADGQTDEGAALAEIVHDLAPGAEILFHTAFRDEADFAEGITELVNCGADVIVDDVFYLREPMFQDGIVAQAAQEAVDAGVVYFSAAGNEGAFGVDEDFVDFAVADDEEFPITGDDLHDFGGPGPDSRFGAITVPDGCEITLVLQWNEPFEGALGPGSANDLDLYFCSSPTAEGCDDVISWDYSEDAQGCGAGDLLGDPFESLDWTNDTGSPVTGYVAVNHFCGDESDTRFRIVTFTSCDAQSYTFEPGIFDKAQIYGHPAAAGVNAVASVFYGEIDSGGTVEDPPEEINVDPSSALGGNLPFYFDGSGTPLVGAPVDRFKPDMAAPDGVNNTFFGIDTDADLFPNFFGTSAAAAHPVGVAALLLEVNPALTPQQAREALGMSATDIESAGVDALSGAGLIDAHAAVLAMPTVPLLEVGPASIDFGIQSPGTSSAPLEATLQNVNQGLNPPSEQVHVSAITVSDTTNFGLDVNGGASPCASSTPTIAWGDSCTVTVVAQPQSGGPFNANLTVDSNSAVGPSQAVSLTAAGCATSVDLTGGPSGNPEVEEACADLTAGPYAIGSGDDVTFRAGETITLRNDFSVDSGGAFVAALDPVLLP